MNIESESFTRSLRVGSLVAMSNRTLNSVIAAVVLHRVRLDEDSLDESLADSGWRLAEFRSTGYRILVRPTSFVSIGVVDAVRVETCDIETGVRHLSDDSFAIVAQLGEKRRSNLARRDSISLERAS